MPFAGGWCRLAPGVQEVQRLGLTGLKLEPAPYFSQQDPRPSSQPDVNANNPIQLVGELVADLSLDHDCTHRDMKGAARRDRPVQCGVRNWPGAPSSLQACAELDQSVQQQKSQFIALITDASGRASWSA
jgi:hypothetical protein